MRALACLATFSVLAERSPWEPRDSNEGPQTSFWALENMCKSCCRLLSSCCFSAPKQSAKRYIDNSRMCKMCREISKFSNPPKFLSRFAQRLRNVFWPSHGMAQLRLWHAACAGLPGPCPSPPWPGLRCCRWSSLELSQRLVRRPKPMDAERLRWWI